MEDKNIICPECIYEDYNEWSDFKELFCKYCYGTIMKGKTQTY